MSEKLPALLLAAERVAATVAQGVHGRRRAGQGESFWQYRPYTTDEGRARIDWRQSGKSDNLYVRETEWEAAQNLWIWRDNSPTMAYSSHKKSTEKGQRADVLLLALACLSLRAGEHVGHLTPSQNSDQNITPPRAGNHKNTLPKLAQSFLESQATSGGETSFSTLVSAVPDHSNIILASDFLEDIKCFEARLKILSQKKLNVTFLSIFDSAERDLPFKGRIKFTGLKEETPLFMRKAQDIRQEYKNKRVAHFEHLKKMSLRHNGIWLSHCTQEPPESCLLTLHQSLGSFKARVRAR